jgi:rhodanese-related sulfurtransferase
MQISRKHFYTFFTGIIIAIIFSSTAMAENNYLDITVNKAAEMIEQMSSDAPIVILDVRTKGEFDSGHLNDALNLDVKSASFKEKISKLDKDKTYLVYCRSGKRSKRAQNIMKELHFKKAINMLGGFIAWQKAGQPFSK